MKIENNQKQQDYSQFCYNTERANTSSSPSRPENRLLFGNPVYQSKYVIKNSSEARHRIQTSFNKKKFIPNFEILSNNMHNFSNDTWFSSNQLRTNRSCEGTSRLKRSKINMTRLFKSNLKPKTIKRVDGYQTVSDFSKNGFLYKSCDMNNSRKIWKIGNRDIS